MTINRSNIQKLYFKKAKLVKVRNKDLGDYLNSDFNASSQVRWNI